jgi:hypothetical protein
MNKYQNIWSGGPSGIPVAGRYLAANAGHCERRLTSEPPPPRRAVLAHTRTAMHSISQSGVCDMWHQCGATEQR